MDTPTHTIASLRVRLGLTQAELADKATEGAQRTDPAGRNKVSVSTVCRAERGESVHLDHLRAIAGALGVTVDVLIAALDEARAQRAGRGAA